MRYKAYITDSDQIFWTKNSTDKPSKDYFYSLMESINWTDLGNITPNFITQFNCNITVDRDSYTYLKLVDNQGITKYFCVDGIERILQNGFVISLSLDVFTTYGYYLFENITNRPFKIIRSNHYGLYKKMIKRNSALIDDLLNIDYPISRLNMRDYNSELSNSISKGDDEGYKIIYYDFKVAPGNEITITSKSKSDVYFSSTVNAQRQGINFYENFIFDAYQYQNGEWLIIPIFTPEYIRDDAIYWLFKVQGEPYYQAAVNSLYHVERLKNTIVFSPRYKGRFYIPCFSQLIQNCWVNKIRFTDNNLSIIGFRFKNGINNFKPNLLNEYIPPQGTYFIDTVNPNSNLLHWYVLRNVRGFIDNYNLGVIKKYGNNYGISPYIVEKTNFQSGFNFSFNEKTGATFFTDGVGYYDYCLNGNETFPIETDGYINYLAGVQSSQNTSIQIAKQQSVMSGVSSGLNAALGLAGAIKTGLSGNIFGGIVGGISSLFNGATGIAQATLQYQNHKKQIDAQNADKMRTATANNIYPTSQQANYINGAIKTKFVFSNSNLKLSYMDGIVCKMPTSNNDYYYLNMYLNRVIWNSGFLFDLDFTSREYSGLNFFTFSNLPFLYWELEINADYVKQIFKNYNQELIDAISICVNNPVRFWKQYPDYNISLELKND